MFTRQAAKKVFGHFKESLTKRMAEELDDAAVDIKVCFAHSEGLISE